MSLPKIFLLFVTFTVTVSAGRQQKRKRLSEATLRNPSIGTDIRIPVLLLRFADHTGRNLPSKEYYQEILNGPDLTVSDTFPRPSPLNSVGSVASFFNYASLKKYQITFDVYDWFTLSGTEAYYAADPYGSSNFVSGLTDCVKPTEMFGEAFTYIQENIWQGTEDYWKYDTIGDPEDGFDGFLDNLVVIHSGFDALYGSAFPKGTDTCSPTDYSKRMWARGCSFTSEFGTQGWGNTEWNIGGWSMTGAFSDCKSPPTPQKHGIVIHEAMHSFGLIDLYVTDTFSYNYPTGSKQLLAGTGYFDIMSNIQGWRNDGSYPTSLGPYSRIKAGWLEPIPISQPGVYSIMTSQVSSQVYIITEGFPPGEYLLIENRQPVIWDKEQPAGGILIWHVDENVSNQNNINRYRVRLEQADGNYDIEKGNLSDVGDFWTIGMTMGPGGSKPNTDTNDGDFTCLSITILSPSSMIMSFRVEKLCGAWSNPGGAPVSRPRPEDQTIEFTPDVAGPPLRPILDIQDEHESEVGNALAWVFSLLGGISLLLGLAVVLL